MAFLPAEPLKLKGGCCCKLIEYQIKVPAFEDRPLCENAYETPLPVSKGDSTIVTKVPTRLPVVDLDHCDTCRKTSGAIIQCWFICPIEWVAWSVSPLKNPSEPNKEVQRLSLSTVDAVGPRTRNAGNLLENTSIGLYQATNGATRGFCTRCGTCLTYVGHSGLDSKIPVVDISVGSMDVESLNLARPDRHGWYNDGIDWVKDILTRGDKGLLIRHPNGFMNETVDA